jgi:hypothetical protein
MNRVPVAAKGEGTTAPGRGVIPGRVGAGAVEDRDSGGATRGAGSRGGAPAQPERTSTPAARSAAAAALQAGMPLDSACISYPAGGVVPPGGAGVTIFAICMKGVSRSIGTGKMVVELFSDATSRSVWR